MPTATYTPIASTTLSSSQSTVTFSNLDTAAAGMRDLILVMRATGATGGGNFRLAFNSSTANFTRVYMTGSGSSASSGSQSDSLITDNAFWNTTSATMSIVHIFDFSQTNKHKSVLARSDNAANGTDANALRWANTSAITSITIDSNLSSQFASGSTFSLWGVIA